MYGEDMIEINQSKHTGCNGGSKIIHIPDQNATKTKEC